MIFRNQVRKADIEGSWKRADRPFFASGACHILAAVFIETHASCGFKASYILPRPGFRGGHVVASDGRTVFDYHGYSGHERYVARHFAKLRRLFPGWEADIIEIGESLTSRAFCEKYNHRRPEEFFDDPVPRGMAFVSRFPSPRSRIDLHANDLSLSSPP